MQIKNTDWKKLYVLLNDLIISKNTESLITELENNIENIVPADRGLPIFEIRDKVPYCKRWPEYSSKLIPQFNFHFNEICPVKFSSYSEGMFPVSWKIFKNSEYDTDFNTPLDIGFSMGQGFYNNSEEKLNIIVINRSRKSKSFTDCDFNIFTTLIDSFATLYNQRKICSEELTKRLHILECQHGCRLLSDREIQICRMFISRLTASDIAKNLNISRRTVERHIEHIYFKLNIKNKKELFRLL